MAQKVILYPAEIKMRDLVADLGASGGGSPIMRYKIPRGVSFRIWGAQLPGFFEVITSQATLNTYMTNFFSAGLTYYTATSQFATPDEIWIDVAWKPSVTNFTYTVGYPVGVDAQPYSVGRIGTTVSLPNSSGTNKGWFYTARKRHAPIDIVRVFNEGGSYFPFKGQATNCTKTNLGPSGAANLRFDYGYGGVLQILTGNTSNFVGSFINLSDVAYLDECFLVPAGENRLLTRTAGISTLISDFGPTNPFPQRYYAIIAELWDDLNN